MLILVLTLVDVDEDEDEVEDDDVDVDDDVDDVDVLCDVELVELVTRLRVSPLLFAFVDELEDEDEVLVVFFVAFPLVLLFVLFVVLDVLVCVPAFVPFLLAFVTTFVFVAGGSASFFVYLYPLTTNVLVFILPSTSHTNPPTSNNTL